MVKLHLMLTSLTQQTHNPSLRDKNRLFVASWSLLSPAWAIFPLCRDYNRVGTFRKDDSMVRYSKKRRCFPVLEMLYVQDNMVRKNLGLEQGDIAEDVLEFARSLASIFWRIPVNRIQRLVTFFQKSMTNRFSTLLGLRALIKPFVLPWTIYFRLDNKIGIKSVLIT